MSTFTGGALKLKDGTRIQKDPKKKKKRKALAQDQSQSKNGSDQDPTGTDVTKKEELRGERKPPTTEGDEPPGAREPGGPAPSRDTRTEAEKKYDASILRRHERDLAQGKTLLTHQEKVTKFNEYLMKLPEHNDIQKTDGSW